MIDPVAGQNNLAVFFGVIIFLAVLELAILGLIVFLTVHFEASRTRDTRENLWRAFFSILAALTGLLAGRGLG